MTNLFDVTLSCIIFCASNFNVECFHADELPEEDLGLGGNDAVQARPRLKEYNKHWRSYVEVGGAAAPQPNFF